MMAECPSAIDDEVFGRIRCDVTEPHRIHRWEDGNVRWLDGPRVLVDCDDLDCLALAEPDPESAVELKTAYEHWRSHRNLGGCSHGN